MFNVPRYTPKFNITGGSETQGIDCAVLIYKLFIITVERQKIVPAPVECHHHRVIFFGEVSVI